MFFPGYQCERWALIEDLVEETQTEAKQLVEATFKTPMDGKQRLRCLLDEHKKKLYIGALLHEMDVEEAPVHASASAAGEHIRHSDFQEFWEAVLAALPDINKSPTGAKAKQGGGPGKATGLAANSKGHKGAGKNRQQSEWGSGWNDPIESRQKPTAATAKESSPQRPKKHQVKEHKRETSSVKHKAGDKRKSKFVKEGRHKRKSLHRSRRRVEPSRGSTGSKVPKDKEHAHKKKEHFDRSEKKKKKRSHTPTSSSKSESRTSGSEES